MKGRSEMEIKTELLSSSDEDIKKAAAIIKRGGVVGMPTETVYGLAADAADNGAVEKIFIAKGRPQDNPLIVHIADISDFERYGCEIPDTAYILAESFWPGPLTMVVKKRDIIPDTTSGGLDTVGIRFPVHPAAQKLIRESGTALAAPSANLSGSPSPTTAQDVMKDMSGRVPAVIDGGSCPVGVESTVVCFEDGNVKILRPGFVSGEDIGGVIGKKGLKVLYAHGITEEIAAGEKVLSPGMKYKHYSPKANVTLVRGGIEDFITYVGRHDGSGTYSMIFDSDADGFPYRYIPYGDTSEEQARALFRALRHADELGAKQVYVRCPEISGVGLAVYNRLLRAAAFEEVQV